MNNTCPNGYICINHFQGIIIIIIILSVLYVFNNNNYRTLFGKQPNQIISSNQVNSIDNNNLMQQPIQEQTNHDRRVISNPLYPPLQRGISINEETRESGGDYQQLGILSKNSINNGEGTPGNNTDSVVLPLYGKPTYRGSNKWLYYTETDKLHPIKIPVTYKNKDCTDDYGCDEIYDGDNVVIPSYNGDFKVKIYKMNKPRYIPYV